MAENPDDVLRALHGSMRSLWKDLLRTRQIVYAMQAESRLRAMGRQPRLPLEFTSQYGEDLIAWDLFGGQTEGFFIEAGAFDGYHYSATHALEAIGWTGLLVEPHPQACARCASLRRASRVVQAALGPRGASGTTEFVVLDDQFGGMLSFRKGTAHPAFAGDPAQTTVTVPLTSLANLLAPHRGEIDLAVIDVEGGEIDVLDGFELERFPPRLLFVEANEPQAIMDFMGRYPYVYAGHEVTNLIFIRRDQNEMLDRLRWLRL